MKQSNINKKGVAFLEGNTWYYRSKRLEDDGTIKYEKIEGVSNREEAERQYHKADKEFRVAVRKYLLENKKIDDISFKDYLIYWFEDVYSARIQNTTKMVGSYTLYNLILPNIEKDNCASLTILESL